MPSAGWISGRVAPHRTRCSTPSRPRWQSISPPVALLSPVHDGIQLRGVRGHRENVAAGRLRVFLDAFRLGSGIVRYECHLSYSWRRAYRKTFWIWSSWPPSRMSLSNAPTGKGVTSRARRAASDPGPLVRPAAWSFRLRKSWRIPPWTGCSAPSGIDELFARFGVCGLGTSLSVRNKKHRPEFDVDPPPVRYHLAQHVHKAVRLRGV